MGTKSDRIFSADKRTGYNLKCNFKMFFEILVKIFGYPELTVLEFYVICLDRYSKFEVEKEYEQETRKILCKAYEVWAGAKVEDQAWYRGCEEYMADAVQAKGLHCKSL